MKRRFIFPVILLVILFSANSAYSQIWPCYDWDVDWYAYSEVLYSNNPMVVGGEAGTEIVVFDYSYGCINDFNAWIYSELANSSGLLNYGGFEANGWEAEGGHPFFYAQYRTYCVTSAHGFVAYMYNPYGKNFPSETSEFTIAVTRDCHTFVPPPPTPTPTPPCLIECAEPTPTPTPSPEIRNVEFEGDHEVYYLSILSPITGPTWEVGSPSNAQRVVAYTKGTEATKMKLSAVFAVLPSTPGQNLNAKVRVKYDGDVKATTPNSIAVTSGGFYIQNLALDSGKKLEQNPSVKKGTYDFNWEVSFNNGQSWVPAGTSQHIIYWTYADPRGISSSCTSTPRSCVFLNDQGDEQYPHLFDEALKKAIDGLSSASQTPELIAKDLARKVDDEIMYDPEYGFADTRHPLRIYDAANPLVPLHRPLRAQCSANANLLSGLLRSIGIASEVTYFWGGQPTNSITGGKRYSYYLRLSSTLAKNVSFKTKRPRKNTGGENIEENPHFSFHAVVNVAGKYFDPSYGKDVYSQSGYPYSSIILEETVNLSNISTPVFRSGNQTIPFVVKAETMSTFGSDFAGPNAFCPHGWRPPVSPPSSWPRRHPFAVFRPSEGNWYFINPFDTEISVVQFGEAGDKPVPADYDGDGKTDYAVFRPSNGTWYFNNNAGYYLVQFGIAGDRPVFGDFDGDGKSDISVFRTDTWYRLDSSDGAFRVIHFGASGDVPVAGDFDGDGKSDYVVFRPSNHTWYIRRSSDSGFGVYQFGEADDIPVSADFDLDGKNDYAVFRPSTATWYMLLSTGSYTGIAFGDTNSVPSTADYDDDGKPDLATWNPGTGYWKVLLSQTGTTITSSWGISGDIPIDAAYNR